ncbi:Uncharacterised protein [Vibrio cholerae]|nr:Uncharacterised protein [Vibrio cholerae]
MDGCQWQGHILLALTANREHREILRQQLFHDQPNLRRMSPLFKQAQIDIRRWAMNDLQRLG